MTDLKRDFDRAAASWDEEPRRIKMAGEIASAIRAEASISPEAEVVDFGCGTGLLTLHLQPLVKQVTGVDSSRGMLERLEQKIRALDLKNVKTRFVDIDNGDKIEGQYDLITSSMTFHHVKETGPLLEMLYSATAPGGRICVADLDLDDGQFHQDNTGVFHFGFDRTALKKTFEEAGFVDVRDRTATTMTRPVTGGGQREFSVFLITGCKDR